MQIKATEQYFPVVLFIMLFKMILTIEFVNWTLNCDYPNESYWAVLLSLEMKSLSVTIQRKSAKKYFPVVFFITLFKMVHPFGPLDDSFQTVNMQMKAIEVLSCYVLFGFENLSIRNMNFLPQISSWLCPRVNDLISESSFCKRKVMLSLKPCEWMIEVFLWWHNRHTRKKKFRVLPTGVEPKTFRLLVKTRQEN